MRVYSSEPLHYVNSKLKLTSLPETQNYDIYEEAWLPVGDEKQKDVARLIKQNSLNG